MFSKPIFIIFPKAVENSGSDEIKSEDDIFNQIGSSSVKLDSVKSAEANYDPNVISEDIFARIPIGTTMQV